MNHKTVVQRFKEGKNYHGSRIFAENNTLYSYGRHFPLAVRRGEEGQEWYLLNGDKYSNSTSTHQGITYSVFNNSPRVSFTALNAAGIYYNSCKLIDFTKDEYEYAYHDNIKFANFKNLMPAGAEYHEKKDVDGRILSKSYHRIGAVILEQGKKHFVCGMDEGSYFISLLPKKVKTVQEAFEVLKPKRIRKENITDYQRQGEWFFIPADVQIKEKDFQKSAALPSADSSSNLHVCTRLKKIGKRYFVKGIIKHRNPRTNRRADHRPLKLGEGIYEAVCNTAKGNWSASGRVD
ncbi:MAG TPA: hypothetical protein ACFYEK_05985 [Candidatus Wunengus sp. YC60]|uniref:hypothetical protein n=1 Tax=Candidatus Wunengus sp. YC60 TaxID=3367697 RepID=UPI004024DA68